MMFRDRAWRCPDDAELAAYIDGNLNSARRERAHAHFADCSLCLERIADFARLQNAPPPELPGRLRAEALKFVRAAPAAYAGRWVTAFAATLCCALLIVVTYRQYERRSVFQPETVRQAPTLALPAIVFPPDQAVISRDALTIQWISTSTSIYYEIRVMSENGDLVWQERSNETVVRVPSDAPIFAGKKYYIGVDAVLNDGKPIKYNSISFQIRQP